MHFDSIQMTINRCFRCLVVAWVALPVAACAVTQLAPSHDDEVLEVLPAITQSRPSRAAFASATPSRALDPSTAALQARADIAVARQTGDTRYWGRAQALLAPWWDRADAPPELAVLQATVQQGRHEFAASRTVLVSALARAPGNAQGWLNLAALERLSARYEQSLAACDAVQRAAQAWYATACRLETMSLQGQHAEAVRGLQAMQAGTTSPEQASWLWSLMAEARERAGQDGAATEAYTRSLALSPDLYTAIAYTDLLLRSGKLAPALRVLEPLPDTDAVLLRRAAAWRRLADRRWLDLRETLRERAAESQRRGDDPALHGREAALVALWLDDDPARALVLARANLLLQREPLDWWVAMRGARQARDAVAEAEISGAIRAAGLVDVRLAAEKVR